MVKTVRFFYFLRFVRFWYNDSQKVDSGQFGTILTHPCLKVYVGKQQPEKKTENNHYSTISLDILSTTRCVYVVCVVRGEYNKNIPINTFR